MTRNVSIAAMGKVRKAGQEWIGRNGVERAVRNTEAGREEHECVLATPILDYAKHA